MEYQEWRRQLRAALESCLETLPPEQVRVIRARYFEGLTLAAVGEQTGNNAEWVRIRESRALRGLRKPRSARRLQEFREDIIGRYALHTGFGSITRNQGSATAERPMGYTGKGYE